MNKEELKESFLKYGSFYPILKDKFGKDIDGLHRRKAIKGIKTKEWPEETLDWVDNDYKREIVGLLSNVNRRGISGQEIERRIVKILESNKERYFDGKDWNLNLLAEDLCRSYSWIKKYTPQKFKSEVKIKAGSESRHDSETKLLTPKEWKIYNVWEAENKRPEGYGDKTFHGNTPPSLAKECLESYSNENDLILDPMAGSGTLIDLCKEMNRKILAFDIKPLRDDIKYANAEYLKLDNNSVDFIFCHFPYWNLVKYSDNENDLSNLDFNEFLEKSEEIMKEMHRVLKQGGFFAILIGDLRKNKKIWDLSAHLSLMGCKSFSLFDKIIFWNKQQRSLSLTHGMLSKKSSEKTGFHLLTFNTLLVFKK